MDMERSKVVCFLEVAWEGTCVVDGEKSEGSQHCLKSSFGRVSSNLAAASTSAAAAAAREMSLKHIWEKWDVRVVILVSLAFQIFLIVAAPLRKRFSVWWITVPVWVAYLGADAIAIYSVGLIAKSQVQELPAAVASADLMVFWSPFLLVHLGGPDTITAFALEDNELWLRHSLSLVSQSFTVIYVFYLSFFNKRTFLIPAILMFISGAIKYGERIYSLYLASSRRFRESLLTDPDPGPNYAKLMDEYSSKKEAGLPTRIDFIPEPERKKVRHPDDDRRLSDLEVIRRAHYYFKTFKGLIADLIFSFRERTASRAFFLTRNSWEAFKIVEVELNFIYEILFTKAQVVQYFLGYVCRIASFTLTCIALLLFKLKKKDAYKDVDIIITYVLMGGAVALDVIAFFMVLISDWTAVALSDPDTQYSGDNKYRRFMINVIQKTKIKRFLSIVLLVERTRWPRSNLNEKKSALMKIFRRRWSKTISQYNLIGCCLRPRPKWLDGTLNLFGITNKIDSLQYAETKDFEDDLRDMIFDELKMKSQMAEDLVTAREIYAARGDWTLRFTGYSKLLPWIDEVDYDESLLLLHLATEFLYRSKEPGQDIPGVGQDNPRAGQQPSNPEKKDFRGKSKLLSDYMLYLLIMQTNMLSTVAGIGQIRYRDTCAETKKFFRGRNIKADKSVCCRWIPFFWTCCCCVCGNKPPRREIEEGDTEWAPWHDDACKSILGVQTVVKPVTVKGDRSKSLLFDASMFAQALQDLNKDERTKKGSDSIEDNKEQRKLDKWELIFRMWVEIMCYAASHCRASTHAAQLSKGGQLITLVWLLMAHLGLGNQFQISEGHARAKLIVGK